MYFPKLQNSIISCLFLFLIFSGLEIFRQNFINHRSVSDQRSIIVVIVNEFMLPFYPFQERRTTFIFNQTNPTNRINMENFTITFLPLTRQFRIETFIDRIHYTIHYLISTRFAHATLVYLRCVVHSRQAIPMQCVGGILSYTHQSTQFPSVFSIYRRQIACVK